MAQPDVKIEPLDLKAITSDQNLSSNSIGSNFERNQTISSQSLYVAENVSSSIYSEFECKDDPLSVALDSSGVWSHTYDVLKYGNPSLDMLLNYKSESMKADEDANYKNFQGSTNLHKLSSNQCERKSKNSKHRSEDKYNRPHGKTQKWIKYESRPNRKNTYGTISKTCLHCNFTAKKSYRVHSHILIIHDLIRQFGCKLCEYSANRLDALKKHTIKTHQYENVWFEETNHGFAKIEKKCPHCNFIGRSCYRAHMHILNFHDQIKQFRCNLCEYSTIFSPSFKKHMITKHDNEYALLEKQKGGQNLMAPKGGWGKIGKKCSHCKFIGALPSLTQLHIMEIHDQIRQNCSFCDYNGKRLKEHIVAVHDQIRPFPCKFCEYSTKTPFQLKVHVVAKHQDKNLQGHDQLLRSCPYCLFQSMSKNYVTRLNAIKWHIMTIHDCIRPYHCKFCDYSTASLKMFKKHNYRVHEDELLF